TRDLANSYADYREKLKDRRNKREQGYQEALAKAGIGAVVRRLGRAARAMLRPLEWFGWRIFVVNPSALLLKRRAGLRAMWRELVGEDAPTIALRFISIAHGWASTHALGEEALRATTGR